MEKNYRLTIKEGDKTVHHEDGTTLCATVTAKLMQDILVAGSVAQIRDARDQLVWSRVVEVLPSGRTKTRVVWHRKPWAEKKE